jgi:hypothetical protein
MLHALASGGLRALDQIFDNGQYSAALKEAGVKICNAYTAIRTIHPQVTAITGVTMPLICGTHCSSDCCVVQAASFTTALIYLSASIFLLDIQQVQVGALSGCSRELWPGLRSNPDVALFIRLGVS